MMCIIRKIFAKISQGEPNCPISPFYLSTKAIFMKESDIKHVFICSNPYIYTIVVQEVYNYCCGVEMLQ